MEEPRPPALAEPNPAGRWRWVPLRVGALLLAALLLVGTLQAFAPTAALQEGSRVVEIPLAVGLHGMARLLEEEGVIRSPLSFVLVALLRGSARTLKAGEYEIPQGASLFTIVRLIEEGRFRPRIFTLPEGSTLQEAAERLEAEELVSGGDVRRLARDPAFLRSLGITAESLEGYLFPDTYYFFKGMRGEEILAKMVHRLQEVLTPELRSRAEELRLPLHGLLTLASIVEKEAVLESERSLISAVFWNRLKRDMPLQADPTVGYAVNKKNRLLTLTDLRVDSPYNTYRYRGLPPTPIGNPGKPSILAVLYPAKADYLYFVSIDGIRHHFSTTWPQHATAVTRYRVARQGL